MTLVEHLMPDGKEVLFMLKLTHTFEPTTCPTCAGRRKVPCPTTLAKNLPNERGHFLAPSTGKPIPCPECNGKGVVYR